MAIMNNLEKINKCKTLEQTDPTKEPIENQTDPSQQASKNAENEKLKGSHYQSKSNYSPEKAT